MATGQSLPVEFIVTVPHPLLAMNFLDSLFFFLSRLRVHFSPEKFLFAQKLPAVFNTRRIQSSRAQCRPDRAPWLRFMAAIAESAFCRQQINVAKNLRNTALRVPQLHLAQTRSVHQQRASRQDKQFTRRGGVPPAAITIANRLHVLDRLSQKPVRHR